MHYVLSQSSFLVTDESVSGLCRCVYSVALFVGYQICRRGGEGECNWEQTLISSLVRSEGSNIAGFAWFNMVNPEHN